MLLSVCICLVEYVPAAHRESGPELRSVPRPPPWERADTPLLVLLPFLPCRLGALARPGVSRCEGSAWFCSHTPRCAFAP